MRTPASFKTGVNTPSIATVKAVFMGASVVLRVAAVKCNVPKGSLPVTVTLRSLTANFKSCKILITLLAKIGPKPLSKSTIIIEPSGLRVAACDHAP